MFDPASEELRISSHHGLRSCIGLAEECMQFAQIHIGKLGEQADDRAKFTFGIIGYAFRRLHASMRLLKTGQAADAAILARTGIEGLAAPLAYMCSDDDEADTVFSAWRDAQVNNVNRLGRVSRESVPLAGIDTQSTIVENFLKHDGFDLNESRSSRERSALAKNWSFDRLMNRIEEAGIFDRDKLAVLRFYYSYLSSFSHGDLLAVLWQQQHLNEEEVAFEQIILVGMQTTLLASAMPSLVHISIARKVGRYRTLSNWSSNRIEVLGNIIHTQTEKYQRAVEAKMLRERV